MTARLSDERLEDDLKAALRSLRPAEAAPARLRQLVDGIPAATHQRPWWRLALDGSPAALGVATLAGLAAVAILVVALRPTLPTPPGSGGTGTVQTFDPTIEGPGLVYNVTPTLLIVPGLVAIVAAGRALWLLRPQSRPWQWRHWLQPAVLIAVAAASAGLALERGFEWLGGSVAPVLGYGVQEPPPAGYIDGVTTYYETARPGDPAVLLVTITNPGPLPIQLEGIVEDPLAPQQIAARWIGMTTRADPMAIPNELDKLQVFQPKVAEPGGTIDVYLVTKAGACAFGPDFKLNDQAAQSFATRDREIHFAYSVFGLWSTAPFELPANLVEPYGRCP